MVSHKGPDLLSQVLPMCPQGWLIMDSAPYILIMAFVYEQLHVVPQESHLPFAVQKAFKLLGF